MDLGIQDSAEANRTEAYVSTLGTLPAPLANIINENISESLRELISYFDGLYTRLLECRLID